MRMGEPNGVLNLEFGVVLHGITSDLRLNNWLEYLHLNEMTENPLCQGKSAFSNLIAENDSGLEK